VAIADVDSGQAAERGRPWGFPEARIYDGYRALRDDPGINAVEICSP
jgi:predicted dehydrogenase